MAHDLRPATRPTMYFIGVTTAQSSINRVFPRWAERLQLGDCELRGLDFPLQTDPADYRRTVEFIRHDPLTLGALVTTHKVGVHAASHDLFAVLDPLTRSLGEISSIFKRDGQLHGRAADPWACGHGVEAFVPRGHWRNGGEALILGGGGAGCALAWQLARAEHGTDRPARIHIADQRRPRLEHLRSLHATWPGAVPMEFHHVQMAREADALVARLPAGSMVVNATGAGKDTPGSPVTDDAIFPERGLIWEFNYRGDLVFLAQARAQQARRALQIEDGWTLFLHGWTGVMADVFAREIPTRGPLFEELGRIAAATR